MFRQVANRIDRQLIDWGYGIKRGASGQRIVMYHGVDLLQNRKFNSRFISITNLERQLCYFKKNFSIVPVANFFDNEPATDNKFTIAITFDDGYENNFKYALPLFEKLQIPATFYITGMANSPEKIIWSDLYDIYRANSSLPFTSNSQVLHKDSSGVFRNANGISFPDLFKSDSRPMFERLDEIARQFATVLNAVRIDERLNDYWKLMSNDQIIACSKSKYITIGSHGYYHNNLGNLDHKTALEELALSKKYLENLTQRTVNSVAYPDGSYNLQLVDRARTLGFIEQLAVTFNNPEHRRISLIKDRFGIYALPVPENEKRIAYNVVQSSR